MFSPSYLQNNRQSCFTMPLNYQEKTAVEVGPIYAGELEISFRPEGDSYKLLGVYYGGVNVLGLITYLERNAGTPLFPQIQAAIENHIGFMQSQPEPVSDDHTMNLQNTEQCLNS